MPWFKRRSDQPAPGIEELTESERDWLQEHLGVLADLDVDADDPESLGRFYDDQLQRWTALPVAERDDPNTLVHLVGLGLGEYLRKATGTRWVIATDAYGTGIALHREAADLLVHPVDLVAKRWTANEVGTIPELAKAMTDRIGTVASHG